MTAARDSNRHFGLVLAVAFCGLAGLRAVWTGTVSVWLIGIGMVCAVLAWLAPSWLDPVRAAWMKLAAVLGAINSRILLTIVFAALITPIGLLLRLLGRRPMELHGDPSAKSYWRTRQPDEFTAPRMERQF